MNYVYVWSRPSGEPFYVGISRYEHRMHCPIRNKLTNSVRAKIERNGGKVHISYVIFSTLVAAMAEEQRLIAKIGRRIDGTGPLTNIATGGEGGSGRPWHTLESRAKMSVAHRGVALSPEHRAALSRGRIGVGHNEEQRRAISVRMRGNKNSAGYRQTAEHVAKREAKRMETVRRKRLAAAHGPAD